MKAEGGRMKLMLNSFHFILHPSAFIPLFDYRSIDIRRTFAMGLRVVLPSRVVTTSWPFSTVMLRTAVMSRSNIWPSSVMMTSRPESAAGVAGSVPPEG
jgi:hypothetical protein